MNAKVTNSNTSFDLVVIKSPSKSKCNNCGGCKCHQDQDMKSNDRQD